MSLSLVCVIDPATDIPPKRLFLLPKTSSGPAGKIFQSYFVFCICKQCLHLATTSNQDVFVVAFFWLWFIYYTDCLLESFVLGVFQNWVNVAQIQKENISKCKSFLSSSQVFSLINSYCCWCCCCSLNKSFKWRLISAIDPSLKFLWFMLCNRWREITL